MDNTAWLVPVPANDQGPQGSIIGVAIPLSCYLITSRTIRVGHGIAHR